jgi:hypothetical protein
MVNTGIESLPNMTRSGVGVVAISQWDSTDAADQLFSVDDLMDDWAPTFAEGLLSFSCFAGTTEVKEFGSGSDADGEAQSDRAVKVRLMAYEQWATQEVRDAFLESPLPSSPSVKTLIAATHGQSPLSSECRLYRSYRSGISEEELGHSRNIVIDTVDFDGQNEQRLYRWIDGVIDALEAEPDDIPGLICAYLHVSASGTRVVNFAEWTSERAYAEALASGPRGVGQTDLTEWQKVKDFQGVTGDTVNQYAFHRTLATPNGNLG